MTSCNPYKLTLPVLCCYFPLGLVFSVLFVHLGFAWYWAALFGVFVFAGSVLFVAAYMMSAHIGLLPIFFATIFLALRNTFYGVHVIERFNCGWLKKFWLYFALVDATYAILAACEPLPDPRKDIRFCLQVSALVYLYWAGGAVVGALVANWVPAIPNTEFILTCFFLVLALDHFLKCRDMKPFVFSTLAAIISALLLPHQFVFAAICLSVIGLFIWQSKYGGLCKGGADA